MLFRSFYKIKVVVFFLFSFIVVHSQEEEEKEPVRLFTDCNCEKNYIRQEIGYVNHVRDQSQANVQLFIYDVANGSGGRTYSLDFKGIGVFENIFGKLVYATTATMTSDEVRKGLVKKIKSGLLKYILESNMAEEIRYTINTDGTGAIADIDVVDPWNNWLFEVYGEAVLDKETSRKEFEYEVGFESDRITEKWRIRADLEMNQAKSEFKQEGETFTSERIRYSGDGSVVRSLTDHWSVGVFGGATHNTFTNLNFRGYLNPAIEYNIFPYREVLRREIVFAYRVGYFYNDYLDTTVFGVEEEGIFNHSMDVQLRYRQPWGNVYARLRGSTFLKDFKKNRVEFFSRFSVRVFKGLAVTFSGNYELIRDQINLPAGNASIEDVLLQQKQIATDYELGFRVGISYTFGSAFNNIINTRL